MNNFWILCCARSGSTYLARMLSRALHKPVKEMFHPNGKTRRLTRNQRQHIFYNSPITFSPAKVIREHFTHYFSNEDKAQIEKVLPGLQYIYLTRQDHISETVSWYLSEMTGTWQCSNTKYGANWAKTNDVYQKQNIPVNPTKLLDLYHRTKNAYIEWKDFLEGSKYFEIDFSCLIQHPKKTLISVLNFIEINVPMETIEQAIIEPDFIYPMPIRPEKEMLKKELKKMIGEEGD